MPFVELPNEPAVSIQNVPTMSEDRPVPRPPRSVRKSREIRAQNRRREYIERNPDYLKTADHELSNPLLYDSLIRQFLTPAEREAEGKRKGYSKTLESDLLRGEARLADLAQKTAAAESSSSAAQDGVSGDPQEGANSFVALDTDLPAPKDKEEARDRWHQYLIDRFVHGQDEDFDYSSVDFDDSYDTMERRDAEDAWFDEEDPSWASEPGDEHHQHHDAAAAPKTGETGIQDF